MAAAQPAAGAARLHEAVETVHAVLHMAHSRGFTQVRMELHPKELGAIDVHLRSTPDGLVARVVADATQAAGVLREASQELRRSLEAQGLNLHRLDVTTSGQDESRGAFADGNGQPSPRHHQPVSADAQAQADTPVEETTVRLPSGVLVDVLA